MQGVISKSLLRDFYKTFSKVILKEKMDEPTLKNIFFVFDCKTQAFVASMSNVREKDALFLMQKSLEEGEDCFTPTLQKEKKILQNYEEKMEKTKRERVSRFIRDIDKRIPKRLLSKANKE